ncbi:MAG TPA: hypothetical protein VEC57_03025 [Candidatus Limnocylindrales bacterium]|nr:hypothetical protein [Candidatus Limnocylindrales bacterium]
MAAKIGKSQTKTNSGCLKYSHLKLNDKLGADGQDKTSDSCLTNDPKGKLVKANEQLAGIVADCVAQPDFGSNGTNAGGAGSGHARATMRGIFGLNLEQLWRRLSYTDEAASACQVALVGPTGKLYNTIIKEGASALKTALVTAADGPSLASSITAALIADAKGKIQKGEDAIRADVAETCAVTAQSLIELARGSHGATTSEDLADAAVRVTRCEACLAVAGATALELDCDLFDDATDDDSCSAYVAAYVITDESDLITGPLADGQVGDFMMRNDLARFIIQRGNVRDMYSVGGFGGNIIDVEYNGVAGTDNFLEMQPAINIETVINATAVEVVNDGSNGAAAVVRACGPDDVLDFVNPSTIIEDAGLNFPEDANDNNQDVEACTEYILEPDAAYLKLVTTVFNNEPGTTGFYIGDYVNAAGELEQWGSGNEGIGIRLTADDMGVFSYTGFGEAAGIDYGITAIDLPNTSAVPNGGATSYFSTSGVTYILHSQGVFDAILGQPAEFRVASGASRSFIRYFGVGDGSGANAVTLENLVKGKLAGTVSGCVTKNGAPAPGARVSAGPVVSGAIDRVTSTWVVGDDGCYEGTLPEGNYGMAAWREGTPYEGGGATPTIHNVTVAVETPVVQNFDLPQNGTISVGVTDENGNAVPARVSVVGFDPSPDIILGENTGLHRDQNDVHPFGIARAVYTDATGNVTFEMEPGSYQVYVSRGPEYSAYSVPVTVSAGADTPVAAEIARVVDTTGFISSDHHVHGIASADSRVSESDRVRQFAGEGVDNVIMTDHHAHTDLNPRIAAMGFSNFVASTVGEEITTWDTGHYNAYPMTVDPTRPSGGSTDWGGAAAAGEDFASLGSYILSPAEVETLAKTGPTATADTVVQINHIDSHFVPMKIDTSAVPPTTGMTTAERLAFRMDPNGGNLFNHFDALELWNGYNRNHQNQFLNERIGVWFNHLNQGLPITMITDTDTHAFANLESAGGRTWSASSTDEPALMVPGEIAQSVAAGRAVGGQGVYVQTRLIDAADSGNVADLTLAGDTQITVSNPTAGVNLEISIQAPLWAEFDTVRVYSNAATAPVAARPQLFTATPTMTLVKGTHFTVSTVNVAPGVAGGSRQEAVITVPFANMTQDAWFVVVVKGSDGVSRPMFPVFAADLAKASNTTLAHLIDGNLGQSGVTALGVTNALYADVDGNGEFDGPLEP